MRLGHRLRRAVLLPVYAWLYGPGSRLYEVLAAIVSLGEWPAWRRAALNWIADGPVLELGFGTGRLIPDLAAGRGYLGLDPSPWMHARARAHLRRIGPVGPGDVHLLRGRAEAIPIAGGVCAAVVATFPTAYILDPGALAEIRRVLRPGGRLIVVAEAGFTGGPLGGLADRILAWTGSSIDRPLIDRLTEAGFDAVGEVVRHRRSVSHVVVGTVPGRVPVL